VKSVRPQLNNNPKAKKTQAMMIHDFYDQFTFEFIVILE
jgi:hypothetical protein